MTISRERELREANADATARRLNAGELGEHRERLLRIQRRIRGESPEPVPVPLPEPESTYTKPVPGGRA